MKKSILLLITLLIASVISIVPPGIVQRQGDLFPVSIIHMNDFHARFEETNEGSTSCKEGEKCIGGYARAVTVIKELMANHSATNPIFLNAGDNFQGTLWYNIGRWEVTAQFLNLLKADAITLGNHEFDHQIEGVVPFLEHIESPVIVSNIDDSEEPTMQGKYEKSMVIERYGRKIGVIGVILSTTNEIASTGKLKFLDESTAVRNEAALLKQQGIDIIIVLSHCGLEVDYQIARNAGPDIDVIVGGHSHTFMYTGDHPGPDRPQDEYPAIVTNPGGHTVLIVQASAYTKYIGDLTVYFDSVGNVISWEGAPIFLDTPIQQDPDIVRAMQPWKDIIDVASLREVGVARVQIQESNCGTQECNLGSFITDAYAHHYVDEAGPGEWTYAAIAVTNVGGIRTTLSEGILTYGDLVSTIPFENTLDTIELRGDHLLEALEYAATRSYNTDYFNGANLLQVSGLKVVYNVTNPVNSRVVSVDVLCNKCEVPEYFPLSTTENYRIMVGSFLIGGGDGFSMIPLHLQNHKVGPIDIDVLVKYVERMTPIIAGNNGRLTILT